MELIPNNNSFANSDPSSIIYFLQIVLPDSSGTRIIDLVEDLLHSYWMIDSMPDSSASHSPSSARLEDGDVVRGKNARRRLYIPYFVVRFVVRSNT